MRDRSRDAELLEKVATAAVYDPECKVCEFDDRCSQRAPLKDGWEYCFASCQLVRPCTACKQRQPNLWLRDVPLERFSAFLDDPKNEGSTIDVLHALVRKGFEFL